MSVYLLWSQIDRFHIDPENRKVDFVLSAKFLCDHGVEIHHLFPNRQRTFGVGGSGDPQPFVGMDVVARKGNIGVGGQFCIHGLASIRGNEEIFMITIDYPHGA